MVFKKFTCADLSQIARKIMELLITLVILNSFCSKVKKGSGIQGAQFQQSIDSVSTQEIT